MASTAWCFILVYVLADIFIAPESNGVTLPHSSTAQCQPNIQLSGNYLNKDGLEIPSQRLAGATPVRRVFNGVVRSV
uniref:Putative secreted protein n=1 Tax=Anopheles darlingi TaxID=43151 RepID=A0A2M4DBJ7_ANODA